jgi:acetyl esterase
VVGTLETHDATCRAIAAASGSAFLSVGYRLAPEHPFPTPLNDCADAVRYVAQHGADWGVDASRLAVAGDSAGGNLAAAVAIKLRDESGPKLRHQLLLYPVADRDFTRESYVKNGSGEYFLSADVMRYFWDCYLPEGQDDGGLARLVLTDNFANLPSTTLYVAEYDPLADEGLALGEHLQQAGNDIDVQNAKGMIHGFISMFPMVDEAQNWIDRAGARLRDALA